MGDVGHRADCIRRPAGGSGERQRAKGIGQEALRGQVQAHDMEDPDCPFPFPPSPRQSKKERPKPPPAESRTSVIPRGRRHLAAREAGSLPPCAFVPHAAGLSPSPLFAASLAWASSHASTRRSRSALHLPRQSSLRRRLSVLVPGRLGTSSAFSSLLASVSLPDPPPTASGAPRRPSPALRRGPRRCRRWSARPARSARCPRRGAASRRA